MGTLIEKLHWLTIGDDFLFTKDGIPIDLSRPYALDRLIVRKGIRFVGDAASASAFEIVHRANASEWYAHKEGYTELGLLLLASLLQGRETVEITLGHPTSQIKQLFVYMRPREISMFLKVERPEMYASFEYYVQEVHKFPFSWPQQNPRDFDPEALPELVLSCSDYHANHADDAFEKADQLVVILEVPGLLSLAELWLDMGTEANERDEVCLENPLYGFGGVSQRSVEARFWLPGSLGFYTDELDDLRF